MSPNPAIKQDQPTNILSAFAQTQLQGVKRQLVAESAFLELLTCAFFYGAYGLLRKQTQLNSQQNQSVLVSMAADICGVSERNANDLINALDRFANKYYLVENIVEQGKAAAEQWLNCDDQQNSVFAGIVNKYKNHSMFDLGIEGINEIYEKQQKELYSDVSRSVSKLRMRTLLLMLLVVASSYLVLLVHSYI